LEKWGGRGNGQLLSDLQMHVVGPASHNTKVRVRSPGLTFSDMAVCTQCGTACKLLQQHTQFGCYTRMCEAYFSVSFCVCSERKYHCPYYVHCYISNCMCQSKDLKPFSVEYHIVVGLGVEKVCPTMTKATGALLQYRTRLHLHPSLII